MQKQKELKGLLKRCIMDSSLQQRSARKFDYTEQKRFPGVNKWRKKQQNMPVRLVVKGHKRYMNDL